MAERRPTSVLKLLWLPGLVLLAVLVFGATAARAEWKVHYFRVGPSSTQAGGHPDLRIEISTDSHGEQESESNCQCNDLKDADVELPAGFIGNPHAVAYCTDAELLRRECPTDSQVGRVEVDVDIGGKFGSGAVIFHFKTALWNMEPKPNQAGLLAWSPVIVEFPVYTVLSARTGGDYGLDANTDGIEHLFSILGVTYTLWGVPADPIHDSQREGVPNEETGGSRPSDLPLIPFLQNPTSCSATPLFAGGRLSSYEGTEYRLSAPWPRTTGCDQLSFNPSLSAQPTTIATDSASGLEVDLSVPQELSPTTPSPSEIKALTTVLPQGFSINPSAADGKTACTDAEARFGTPDEARCPDFAKIGTVSVTSSALPGPLPGSVYIGAPLPGHRFRIFVTADGFATHVKLKGVVEPDPVTGRLTVSFDELPQSPLTEINLHFFGSERGLLATPTQCGTYAVNSVFTPWDEVLPTQSATQLFRLSSGPGGAACPGPVRPFAPNLKAASTSNSAGAFSPFSINLSRRDGDQELSSLKLTTPPGLLAKLTDIPYCPNSALAAAAAPSRSGVAEGASPSCPAASRIGSSVTGAGAGDHPVYLPGSVYLAGPYRGAPLSLAVVTPAVSGPYDLGNVVVRVALRVDPATARITAVSDPLPQILEGVPLRLRSLLVRLDRGDFTVNPTDCKRSSVSAEVGGDQGGVAQLAAGYGAANCALLPFKPTVSVGVSGPTKRGRHPALHAVVKSKAGEANIRRAAVTLPHSEFLDNAHLNDSCTRVQFAQEKCPPGSVLGHARALTPLLGTPLEGPVYLRSSNHKLPDLVAALNGQIDIELVGRIDSNDGGIRTTFEEVPDAPISLFRIDLKGGKKGLLQNSENLCVGKRLVIQNLTGQNERVLNRQVELRTPCGGGGKG